MKKKILLLTLFSLLLPASMTTHAAGLPTIDVTKWQALLKSRFDEMKQFKEDMEMKAKEMGLDAEIAASKIDNFNNGSSNLIVRQTQNMADLFNLKQALGSLPTQMACEQMAVKADLDTLICDSQKQLTKYSEEVRSIDDPLSAANRKESGEINHLAESYGYSDFDKDGDIDSLDVMRQIIQRNHENPQHMYKSISSLINFNDSHITLDPDQLQAAKDAVVIIAPTYDERERFFGDSPEGVSARLRVEKEKAIQSSVFHTFHTLLSQKASTNPTEFGPSVLQSSKLQSDVFYNEEDFENSISFKASTSQVISPAQMYRYLSTSAAMHNDQAYKKYIQSLRDESLQAQKLMLMRDKIL